MSRTPLAAAARRVLGAALLVNAGVGSDIMAADLSPDVGLQVSEDSVASMFSLGPIILIFRPSSSAHLL
ncbi:hypothetical protein [Actinoplanes xinjiangensis]|uniref:hypothetical protein n=1 Tax=Actinoplanes xinjiangensis TaxID=512350 RepID=UPI00341559B6